MKEESDSELLREIVDEIIAHPVCIICGMPQSRHKHWCPMPRAYEKFGLTVEEGYPGGKGSE